MCCYRQYIKIFRVCPSVTDVGVVTALRFLKLLRLSGLQAMRDMPLWALAIELATSMNTRSFVVLDQTETIFHLRIAECEVATVMTNDQLG